MVTYNGSNAKIYLDGQEKNSVPLSGDLKTETDDLNIGQYQGGGIYRWDGIIDEVRISDTARSGAWIKASYHSGNDSLLTYGGEEAFSDYLSISNSPSSYGFGIIAASSNYSTGLTYFTVTNDGGYTVNITISGTDMTNGVTWTLSDDGNPGIDTIGFKAGLSGGDYNIVVKKSSPYNTLVSGLAADSSQQWGLRLYSPTSIPDAYEKTGTITLTAVEV